MSLSLLDNMMDSKIIVTFLILNFVLSLLFRSVVDFLVEFQQLLVKTVWSAATCVEQLTPKASFHDAKGRTGKINFQEECKSCKKLISSLGKWFIGVGEEVCSADDIEIVMGKLGMGTFQGEDKNRFDGKCRDCRLLDGIIRLLKNKEATIEEMKKSFSVFDANRDGLISPDELQTVMCKLGFKEGMELEDCKRMIQAVDKDGNGMIDFSEFKEMMENVI